MRGKKAKELRRVIYDDYSFRFRQYYIGLHGGIQADQRRKAYQKAKRGTV